MSKIVSVSTDSKEVPQLRLSFKLSAVSPITISPAPSMMIPATVGSATTERLLLHRNDGKELLVKHVEITDAEHVTAKVIPVKEENETQGRATGNPGDLWLEINVGDNAKAGSYRAQAVVTTNHPDQRELTIPLSIRVRELIEAMPETAQIRVRDGKAAGRYTNATIRHSMQEPFEIAKVEASPAEVFTVLVITEGARPYHQLRIGLKEGLDESTLNLPFRGIVKVTTSNPDRPQIEIPVLIAEHKPPIQPTASKVRRVAPEPPSPSSTTVTTGTGKKKSEKKGEEKPD